MGRPFNEKIVPTKDVEHFLKLLRVMKETRTYRELEEFTGLNRGHIVGMFDIGVYDSMTVPTAQKILAAYKRHKQLKVQS